MSKKQGKKVVNSKKAALPATNLSEAETKLAKLKVDIKAGKAKNTSALRAIRRDIARIKTSLREKELSK